MQRRLAQLAYRFLYFLRGVAALIRGVPRMLRQWLREWLELLALPMRVLVRPRALGGEFAHGGREALSMGGGAARGTVVTVLGFLWLIVCSPLLIARFLLLDLPYRARAFAHWNAPKHILFAAVGAVGLIAGLGTWGYYTFGERRATFQRDVYWRMFHYHLDHAEIDKVEKSLTELQRLLPDNGQVSERLNMVRTREAPTSDPVMIRLIMRSYFREQRYDLAAKEAAKLVETVPNDWEALCFLTNDALARRDTEAVRRHIAAMPRPKDAAEQIHLWTVPYALNLFARLGEAARYHETVEFTIVNYLQYLQATDIEYSAPMVKIILLECFDHAMVQIDKRPQLTRYWEALQRVSRSVLHAEGMTASELARLGMSVENQIVYVKKFAALDYITEEQRAAMTAEVESRLTQIWNAVLALDAKNATGYLGLAHQRMRAGDPSGAVEHTDRGIGACGETPLLIAFKARYLCMVNPQAGRAYLESALNTKVKLSPELCKVWYEVERAAGRRDLALAACEKALELEPGLHWAYRGLGEINGELENWSEAAAALDRIRGQLLQDPAGCRLYVRALSECGAFGTVDQLFDEMYQEKRPLDVLVEAIKGLQQARRYDEAVKWARRSLERDNSNVWAMLTLAECLASLAEVGESDWDRDKVHESIKYFRQVQQRQPKALLPANNIAWLEVKALGLPNDAFETAAPLRASEKMHTFPPAFFETLGVIEVARSNFEEGRKFLARAVAGGGAKASYYYHLAEAYHGLNQHDSAYDAIARAGDLPKTPRELAEYLEIANKIRKGR